MKWSTSKKISLIKGLQDSFPNREDLKVFLQEHFGYGIDFWTANTGLKIQIVELVAQFADDTNRLEEHMLYRLTKEALHEVPDDLHLQEAAHYADELLKLTEKNAICAWLDEGPWLNRSTLVSTLKELADQTQPGSRVVLVKGESKTGRTYTTAMIRHLNRQSNSQATIIHRPPGTGRR